MGILVRARWSGETVDVLLRRLKKKLDENGVATSVRRHHYAETESQRRRRKRLKAAGLRLRSSQR